MVSAAWHFPSQLRPQPATAQWLQERAEQALHGPQIVSTRLGRYWKDAHLHGCFVLPRLLICQKLPQDHTIPRSHKRVRMSLWPWPYQEHGGKGGLTNSSRCSRHSFGTSALPAPSTLQGRGPMTKSFARLYCGRLSLHLLAECCRPHILTWRPRLAFSREHG